MRGNAAKRTLARWTNKARQVPALVPMVGIVARGPEVAVLCALALRVRICVFCLPSALIVVYRLPCQRLAVKLHKTLRQNQRLSLSPYYHALSLRNQAASSTITAPAATPSPSPHRSASSIHKPRRMDPGESTRLHALWSAHGRRSRVNSIRRVGAPTASTRATLKYVPFKVPVLHHIYHVAARGPWRPPCRHQGEAPGRP